MTSPNTAREREQGHRDPRSEALDLDPKVLRLNLGGADLVITLEGDLCSFARAFDGLIDVHSDSEDCMKIVRTTLTQASRAMAALPALILLLCTVLACTSGIKDKDPKVRKAAVEKLSDQALLARVVFEDQDELVREAAVVRLTDQVALAHIATEHKIPEVRFTAVGQLTDRTTLEQIVTNEKEALLLRQFANQRLEQVTGVHKYSFH